MSQVHGSVGIGSYHYVTPAFAACDRRVSPKQPVPQGFAGQPFGQPGPTFPSLFASGQAPIPSPPPVLSPGSYGDQNSPNRSPHAAKTLPTRFAQPNCLPPSPRNTLYPTPAPFTPSNLKTEPYGQFVPQTANAVPTQPPCIVPLSSYAYPQQLPHHQPQQQQPVLAPLVQHPQQLQHMHPLQQQQQSLPQQQVPGQQQMSGQVPMMGYQSLPLYRPVTPTERQYPGSSVAKAYDTVPSEQLPSGHMAPLQPQSFTLSKRVLKDGSDAGYYVKRHACQYCGKSFVRPSALQTHTYSHTGEKPFVCDHPSCGRKFSVVSNLRRHQKVHLCSSGRSKA